MSAAGPSRLHLQEGGGHPVSQPTLSGTGSIQYWKYMLMDTDTIFTRYIHYVPIVHTNTEPILVYSGTGTGKEFPRKNGSLCIFTYFLVVEILLSVRARLYLSY